MSKTQKLCLSGIIIAMYVVIMYLTQSFAFGQYQIRLATGFYSISYLFPFLIVPLGLANGLSNLFFGGLGILDVAGGFAVGLITAGGSYLVRKYRMPKPLVIPVIVLVPGLLVPIWLTPILGSFGAVVTYPALAASICIGQIVPAIVGYILIQTLPRTGIVRYMEDK